MKKVTSALLCLLLCFSLLCDARAAGSTVTVQVSGEVCYSEAYRMLELMNQARTSNGLSPLTMDQEMLDVAMQRAFETVLNWDHTRPNGEMCITLCDRIRAENIAVGPNTADTVSAQFLSSSSHRKNIMGNHRAIGIGCVKVGSTYYWVQCFASSVVSTAQKGADAMRAQNIQVLCNSTYYRPVFSVSASSLNVGETAQLSVIWKGWKEEALPFAGVTVVSSDPSVVRANGSTLTGLKSGTSTISVYYGNYSAGAQRFTVQVSGSGNAGNAGTRPGTGVGTGGFVDVLAGAYYADAVKWATSHSPAITSGTDATHFSPNSSCTRAEAVTFLWRAAGCPAPTGRSSGFSDVPSGAYYEKAVIWAVEQGITAGMTTYSFAPKGVCTRAQIVTFLLRVQKGRAASGSIPIVDVPSDSWYANAVSWAVQNGITNGTDATHFSPMATCTRAQIVTFLWRSMK